MTGWWKADSARMLHHHCRRNPELQEELQIQAAVAAGDVHTVRKMLEQGYSPNGRDANGWTLLHFSAARGKERCVRVFLEHGGEFTRCKEKLAMVLSWKCTHAHLHAIFNASLALMFSVIFSSLQRFLWTKCWVLFQARLLSGLYPGMCNFYRDSSSPRSSTQNLYWGWQPLGFQKQKWWHLPLGCYPGFPFWKLLKQRNLAQVPLSISVLPIP